MSAAALCERCLGGIAAAREAVTAGEIVDLAGLDEEVARICDALLAVPQPERADAAAQLRQLAEALDHLIAALAAQQTRRARELAKAAYASAGAAR